MKTLLGIDGGGTKTEALICDEYGNILGRGTAGASNPLFVGKEKAFEAINQSIKLASQYSDTDIFFDYAAICIPGIKKYKSELKCEILKQCNGFYIGADELNAFYGSVAKPYGIAVVSGTGSFAMGINKNAQSTKVGGWGPILGDEGSGYFLGISCLKAVIREYEALGENTVLTSKIKKFFNIKSISELRDAIYLDSFNRKDISSLSKIVYEGAKEDDVVSLEIIDNAAKYLAQMVKVIVKKLDMNDDEYEVVLTGGISNLGDFIIKPFNKYVKEINQYIKVKKPKFTPAVGSLLIAMKDMGVDITNEVLLYNLFNSYKIII